MDYRHIPRTVVNRIHDLEAKLRKLGRQRRPGISAEWRAELDEHERHLREQLAHWRGVRAQQVADGAATDYCRDTVAPGDLVLYRHQWFPVVRCNAKSVSVPHTLLGPTETHTIRYEHLEDVVKPDDPRRAELAAAAWAAARATLGNNQRMHPAWAPLAPAGQQE